MLLNIYRVFVNDIGIKELKTNYNNEKILPEIKRYILKLIINLNKILINFECAKKCIFKKKSQFIIEYLKIVSFIYNLNKKNA